MFMSQQHYKRGVFEDIWSNRSLANLTVGNCYVESGIGNEFMSD